MKQNVKEPGADQEMERLWSSLVAWQVKDLALSLLCSGHCSGRGLIPGPETSPCSGRGQKKGTCKREIN